MSRDGVLLPEVSRHPDTRGQDPWRHLTATELKACTVIFSAEKEVKLTDDVQGLGQRGIRPEEILWIQVSTAGQFVRLPDLDLWSVCEMHSQFS